MIKNQQLYDYYIIEKKHHSFRKECGEQLSAEYSAKKLSPEERMCRRFEYLCSLEVPHIQPFEKIAMVRTVSNLPDCFTDEEWEKIRSEHFVHECGYVSNLSPNYAKVIEKGLLPFRETANEYQKRTIDAIIGLCDRYLEEAVRMNRDDLADIFRRVPRYGARNFREALQAFRILHYALWLEGEYHNTVGRFDQYMYPYFKADIDSGKLTEESALELIEDFFISFNKDSDLYKGAQQGDNGQSMMLGGTLADGSDGFNKLSELCLTASRELKVIDPKINLRVSSKTPIGVFELGTELTKAGLGFPQYSNDDVVLKGLTDLGYAYEDAVNYTVAACWEFIIPGVGFDIPNIGAVNFPRLTDEAIRQCLTDGSDFDSLMSCVRDNIDGECRKINNSIKSVWFAPNPFMSILMDEIKYRNFGMHGCGIASAADALAAVKKYIYDEKKITPKRLIEALDNDYQNDPELLHLLRFEAPKMGTDNDLPDGIASQLLDCFADSLEKLRNCFGGRWRAGTGTAMFYLWHARDLGATADGRRRGEPFGTNFSPSLFATIPDPVSVVRSFSKPNLRRTINGGPLTLEFAAGIFNSEESIKKVAQLISYYVKMGGHQLQLNAVNLELMKDAQAHPELHPQLIVRIWGWSAYFVELDTDFQNHVMARQEYTV